jgi:NitT/TauT family transport system ATP-binding protein
MDEPFVSLDEPATLRLRALLMELWRARPTTVLFVTHDSREAICLANRIVMLSPAPCRVQRQVEVTLDDDERADAAAVDAFRLQNGLFLE